MHRRSGAGEVPDAIHFKPNRIGDVVPNQFKSWMTNPLGNIAFAPCEVVVETDHFLACFHQAIGEVGAKEASATCDQIAGDTHGGIQRLDQRLYLSMQ